jgi:GAF domain-containing protein
VLVDPFESLSQATMVRQQLDEVTGALEALSAALEDTGELTTMLQHVCQQVIQVVPGADMASVTLLRDGKPFTAACTDRRVFDIDADQYRAGSGPCLEAAKTGRIVRVAVESARERWPAFTESAVAAGVASYLCAPLVVDSEHAGALNLYGLHPHGYQELEGMLLELYVTAVETALRATSRYLAAQQQAAHLRTALVSRAVIDQAKGIIMGARGISAEAAFQVLIEQSQQENVKLHDIATRLVTTVTNGDGHRRLAGDAG